MKQQKIIPIFLRDVYGAIDSSPIYELESGVANNDPIFMKGDQIVDLLLSNKNIPKNQVITFVIEGLINVYWENKQMMSNEIEYLKSATNHPQPTFNYISSNDLYEIEGTITPYNIVYIDVNDFLDRISKNNSVDIELSGVNTIIRLEY